MSEQALPVAIYGSESSATPVLHALLRAHPEVSLVWEGDGSADEPPENTRAAFILPSASPRFGIAQACREQGIRVFDLGAAFRFKGADAFERVFSTQHSSRDLNLGAVYGLPELHRANIGGCRLLGCAGASATAVLLALAPLMKRDMIAPEVIADLKLGESAARIEPMAWTGGDAAPDSIALLPTALGLAPQVAAEVEEQLSRLAGERIFATVAPHLAPIGAGLMATCYATLKEPMAQGALRELYTRFYGSDPFVRVLDGDSISLAPVRGTNRCDIEVRVDYASRRLIAVAAIDALRKGSAGQAVQCFNISFGLSETSGLT